MKIRSDVKFRALRMAASVMKNSANSFETTARGYGGAAKIAKSIKHKKEFREIAKGCLREARRLSRYADIILSLSNTRGQNAD